MTDETPIQGMTPPVEIQLGTVTVVITNNTEPE